MTDRLLYGWKAIALFIGCSVTTAKRYHRIGRMPVNRLGAKPVAEKELILAWLRKKVSGG